MQILGHLGDKLGHAITAPFTLAAKPEIATSVGVIARLGQSIINDSGIPGYAQQAFEYISPWIARANEVRNGLGDNAIASISAWVSTGWETIYQQGSIQPVMRLAPVILAAPVLATIATRILGGSELSDGTEANIGQRFREEVTSSHARRAGVAAILTATIAFASPYAPSVATDNLLNLGAFAGAMAFAASANCEADHTIMSIVSTVAASLSTVAAAVLATHYVGGGDLDTIASGFGLTAGVFVSTKIVSILTSSIGFAAENIWTVCDGPVNQLLDTIAYKFFPVP